jgi:hypothetical protein
MNVINIKKSDKKSSYQKKLRLLKYKGLDAKRYCGKINLEEDPRASQRKLRNEWK